MERQNALLSPQKGKNTWYTQETDGLRVMRQVVRAHRTVSAGLRLLCSPPLRLPLLRGSSVGTKPFPLLVSPLARRKGQGATGSSPSTHPLAPRVSSTIPTPGSRPRRPVERAHTGRCPRGNSWILQTLFGKARIGILAER